MRGCGSDQIRSPAWFMGLSVGERLDLQLTLHAGGAHMPDERLRRNEVASRLFAAPEADQITVGFLVAQDGDVRDLQQLGVPDGVVHPFALRRDPRTYACFLQPFSQGESRGTEIGRAHV